jgi:glycosyltransferase involved in cell wall biosynthesis
MTNIHAGAGSSAGKVSIIMPTYNRAKFLMNAVNSVIGQSYSNWELLIVDDCSTDNTKAIVAAIADPRVQYIRLDSNRGAAYCRNLGIKTAVGEFIGFLDSDDTFLPEKLSRHIALFSEKQLEGVISSCAQIDHTTGETRLLDKIQPNENAKVDFICKKIAWRMYPVWRREFLMNNNLFFCESLRNSQDYQFNAFCLLANPRMDYIQDSLGIKNEYASTVDPHKIGSGWSLNTLKSHLQSRRLVQSRGTSLLPSELRPINNYLRRHRRSCIYAALRASPGVFISILKYVFVLQLVRDVGKDCKVTA